VKSSDVVGLGSTKGPLNFEGNLDSRSCFFLVFPLLQRYPACVRSGNNVYEKSYFFIAGHALRWEIQPREIPASAACVLGLGRCLNCLNAF